MDTSLSKTTQPTPTPPTTPPAPPARKGRAARPSEDPDFARLPLAERQRVLRWIGLLEGVLPPGTERQLRAMGEATGTSYATARRHLSIWRATGDWRPLADGRTLRAATRTRTKDRGFREFWAALVEENQRSTRAARRALLRLWQARHAIPGYEDLPDWPEVPPGWSESRLGALAPPKAEVAIMRRGMKAGARYLPQLLRTRVGTWAGSHIQMDDVWHDHYVRFGAEAVRVLEFGALDVWSGCRFAWGTRPRRRQAGGKGHEGLSEREFRFFAASVLWNHGFSPRGTTLMLERGTAALREPVERVLRDHLGDLVRVETGGMQGEMQALLGDWAGRAGGKGNFKSHLESLHNLIHNELAALPGQTGKDRASQKESTYGMVRYQERLLAWAASLPGELAEGLRHPLLDYHTEFLPLLHHIYESAINGRRDHELEGWAEMGRIVTRYTLAPGSGTWLDIAEIPRETWPLVASAAKADPGRWSRRVRLSPGEVWQSGRGELTRASHALLAEMLGPDCARERRVEGSYIELEDGEVSPSPLVYEARVRTPEGRERELDRGERYLVFANPYDPETLLVCDGRMRCLGTAARVRRASLADRAAMEHGWGRAAARTAELLEGVRGRHATAEAEAAELRRHNAALGFGGAPGRNGGRQEAEAAREAAERAQAATVAELLGGEAAEEDDWMEGGSASPYR